MATDGGPLPDYLEPALQVVFVGFNPGERSARTGHHYAGPGNLFWKLLHAAGLTPEPLTWRDDWHDALGNPPAPLKQLRELAERGRAVAPQPRPKGRPGREPRTLQSL